MGAYQGTVIRPSTGKPVVWRLAPGLALLGRQLDQLGITWYSIGNADHLKRSGGHTPWKPGAPLGVVTAIDVMASPYADVERRILKLMKSDFDTSWVDFVNTNGSQYDWDGRRQGSSGDHHLHLEVLGNRTSFTSNLFYAMWAPTPPPVVKPPPVVETPTERRRKTMLVQKTGENEVWCVVPGVGRYHVTKETYASHLAVYGKPATGPGVEPEDFGPEIPAPGLGSAK
jgi:hypothetical protein